MDSVRIPAVGGPACGEAFPMGDALLYVFTDGYGLAHRYDLTNEDGERVYAYRGPEPLEAVAPVVNGWRV